MSRRLSFISSCCVQGNGRAAIQRKRYWCEITARDDIGSDLKAPQLKENGTPDWSYSLVREVEPGDIVFHYSTRDRAIVGASVAGGPLEERSIFWVPHGTSGRNRSGDRSPHPGWWLPIYGFISAIKPLTLTQAEADQEWIRRWIQEKEDADQVPKVPFQRYGPAHFRGNQGYLTKMPDAFVQRWPTLANLARSISIRSEELAAIGTIFPPSRWRDHHSSPGSIRRARKTTSRSSRKPFKPGRAAMKPIVRALGEVLQAHGAVVSTAHPFDLLMTAPPEILFEVKTTRSRDPIFAIREAVGQLLEYQRFLLPAYRQLGVIVDSKPGSALIRYVEDQLGMYLLRIEATDPDLQIENLVIFGGPLTAAALSRYGIAESRGEMPR